ncbi:S8 family peptidase [Candidatus Riflebacteria bacterium]
MIRSGKHFLGFFLFLGLFFTNARNLHCIEKNAITRATEQVLLKFSDPISMRVFLNSSKAAEQLHPRLLWVILRKHEGAKTLLKAFKNRIVHFENDTILKLEPEIKESPIKGMSKTWGIERVGAPEAWEKGLKGAGLIVAVVDTGVNRNHEGIRDNMWVNASEQNGEAGVDDDKNGYIDDIHGYNFFANKNEPMDDHNHGSHVAGTIAGKHASLGNIGVAPDAIIMAVKTHNRRGNGTKSGVVKGILYAVDNGARVMNCSWGGAPEAAEYSQLLFDAISYANEKNVVLVAAAGNNSNNNDTKPVYPANYKVDNMLTVAATVYGSDNLAGFSNYGVKTVHVAAPGSRIFSLSKSNGRYMNMSGTSMASPHVAGAAALAIEYLKKTQAEPVTPKMVRDLIMEKATPVPGTENKVKTGIITVKTLD